MKKQQEVIMSHRALIVVDMLNDFRAGVADFDAEFHEFALKRMGKIYGARIV